MANKKKGLNPIVTGAVVAGVALTAAALSKKENRDKAKKMVDDVRKEGKKIMDSKEFKNAVGGPAKAAQNQGRGHSQTQDGNKRNS